MAMHHAKSDRSSAPPPSPVQSQMTGRLLLLDSDLNVVPVVLVLAGMLSEMDGGDLEDAVVVLAVAAQRGAAPLVLGALGRGLWLLGLGERVGGDGSEGQEVDKRSSTGGRHDEWCFFLEWVKRVKRDKYCKMGLAGRVVRREFRAELADVVVGA